MRYSAVVAIHALAPALLALPAPGAARDIASGPPVQLAQAGSAGGSIGKQGKSVSGGEEAPPPAKPAPPKPAQPRAEPAAKPAAKPQAGPAAKPQAAEARPKSMQLQESSVFGTYSTTLQNTGGSIYDGAFSGIATRFVLVTFTKDRVAFERRPNALGISGSYTGQRSGNRAAGQGRLSTGVTVEWTASW